jgi:uncharacterized protein
MRAVDVHAHLYDGSWYPRSFSAALTADYERRRAAQRGRSEARVHSSGLVERLLSDAGGEATLRVMDRVGIERRVILILDWGLALGEAEKTIEQIHDEILGVCRRFPDRFVGYSGVDPRRPDALPIVQRAVQELGARGLKLHPTSDWALSDPRVHELVDYCGSEKLPVLIHVGRTTTPLSASHSQPGAVAALAAHFPEVSIIAGHSGFEQWVEFAEMPDVPGNLLFDISGWQDLHGGRPDALAPALHGIVAAFPGRVCFGTDSPFFTYNFAASEAAWLEAVAGCGLSEPVLRSLLSGTPIFGDTRDG